MAIEDTLKYHIKLVTDNFEKAHSSILNITKDMAMLANMSTKGAENVKNLERAYNTSFKSIEQRFVSLRDVAESLYKFQTKTWLNMGKMPKVFLDSLTQVQNKLAIFGKKEAVEDINAIADAFKAFPSISQNVVKSLKEQDWKSVQDSIQILPEDIGIRLNEIVTKLKMLEGPQDKATRLMTTFGKISATVGSTITNMYQEIVFMFSDEITSAIEFVRKKFAELSDWVAKNKGTIKSTLDSIIKGLKEVGVFLGGVGKTLFTWGKYFVSVFNDAPKGIKETVKWLLAAHVALKLIGGPSIIGGITRALASVGGRGLMGGGRALGAMGAAPYLGAAALGGLAAYKVSDYTAKVGGKLGGETGSMLGSVLGGAASGAGVGALLGGGVPGAVVGGIAGAAVGLYKSFSSLREETDRLANSQKEAISSRQAKTEKAIQDMLGDPAKKKKLDEEQNKLSIEFAAKLQNEIKNIQQDKTVDIETAQRKAQENVSKEIGRRLAEKARGISGGLGDVGSTEIARQLEMSGQGTSEVLNQSIRKIQSGAGGGNDFGLGEAKRWMDLFKQSSDSAAASVGAIASEMENAGVTAERLNELDNRRAETLNYLNSLEKNISIARAAYEKQTAEAIEEINKSNMSNSDKELAIMDKKRLLVQSISEADQAHAEILNKKKQLREAALKKYELELEMTEKRVELARIDTQIAEAVYGNAAMAFEAIKKTVAELENKRQTQQAELNLAIKQRQEAEATGGDTRAALAKELDLRAGVKRTTLEQLQLLKQVRDGYLDAVQAQQSAIGTFSKLLITSEQNVAIADVGNMKRKNFLTGMANASGNISSKQFSAFGGMTSGGAQYGSGAMGADLRTMQGRMSAQQRAISYGSVNADMVAKMLSGGAAGLVSAEQQAELASRAGGRNTNITSLNQMGTQGIPAPSRTGGTGTGSSPSGDDVKQAADSLVGSAQRLRSAIINSMPEIAGKTRDQASSFQAGTQ